jgi:hypothetical protein
MRRCCLWLNRSECSAFWVAVVMDGLSKGWTEAISRQRPVLLACSSYNPPLSLSLSDPCLHSRDVIRLGVPEARGTIPDKTRQQGLDLDQCHPTKKESITPSTICILASQSGWWQTSPRANTGSRYGFKAGVKFNYSEVSPVIMRVKRLVSYSCLNAATAERRRADNDH